MMQAIHALLGALLLASADARSDFGSAWLPWLYPRPPGSPWPTVPSEALVAVSEIERQIWRQIWKNDPDALVAMAVHEGCRYYAMSAESGSGIATTDVVIYTARENERVARRQSFVTLRYSIATLAFEHASLVATTWTWDEAHEPVHFSLTGCAGP